MADFLATEVDTGKEKISGDGYTWQKTKVGPEHTYGWDIEEDYIYHHNDPSHFHVSDTGKSVEDHEAAKHAKIRK